MNFILMQDDFIPPPDFITIGYIANDIKELTNIKKMKKRIHNTPSTAGWSLIHAPASQ